MKTPIQHASFDHLKCPVCSRFLRKGAMTAPIWEMTLTESEWCQCDSKPKPIFHPKPKSETEPTKKTLLYRVNDLTLPHLITLCAAISTNPHVTMLFVVALIIWFVRKECE